MICTRMYLKVYFRCSLVDFVTLVTRLHPSSCFGPCLASLNVWIILIMTFEHSVLHIFVN